MEEGITLQPHALLSYQYRLFACPQYENAMAQSGDEPLASNLEQLDSQNNAHPESQPVTDEMSFGLAPGAGSTSYLGR